MLILQDCTGEACSAPCSVGIFWHLETSFCSSGMCNSWQTASLRSRAEQQSPHNPGFSKWLRSQTCSQSVFNPFSTFECAINQSDRKNAKWIIAQKFCVPSHVDFSLKMCEKKNQTQTQILKPTCNKNPVAPAAQLAQYKPSEVKGKAPDLEIYRSSSFMSTTQLT